MIRNEAQRMQKIIEMVSAILGVPVTGDTSMEDVKGWDSMRTLQIDFLLQLEFLHYIQKLKG